MIRIQTCALIAALAVSFAHPLRAQERGNVIFFHPDGTGVAHWGALRMLQAGPDGEINWDKLPAMAVYTGHMKDAMTATSHGGATTHAYGVKVVADSFGLDGKAPITAASGKTMSIAEEALEAGRAVGLVQTGHIAEPGTAAFVASVESRRDGDAIAKQVIESGVQVILAGGERFLLPEGAQGRHGAGARKDGLNLIERAKELGYTIVYDRQELLQVNTASTDKLLGVFASGHTFNDQTEEKNRAENKPNYVEGAPTIAEMGKAALEILSRDPDGFFLVAEEEGTDNLGNNNNAPGQIEALSRADAATGVFREYLGRNPQTLLIMAADSDAGGLQVIGPSIGSKEVEGGKPVAEKDENGAPYDGVSGPQSAFYTAAEDKAGQKLPFLISWASMDDVSGAILARGEGMNSDLIRGVVDNTEVYAIMYRTLFGRDPAQAAASK
jgi:alkaline phosphatase